MMIQRPKNRLTTKEIKILALTYAGLSDEQIAIEFGIKTKSIRQYYIRIHKKLDLPENSNKRSASVKKFLEIQGDMPVMTIEEIHYHWEIN